MSFYAAIPGLVTTNNTFPATGFVGQVVDTQILYANRTVVASGDRTIMSLTLTTGLWRLNGRVGIFGSGTSVSSGTWFVGISSTTNSLSIDSGKVGAQAPFSSVIDYTKTTLAQATPVRYVNVPAAGATYYLISSSVYNSPATYSAWGYFSAVRIA